MNKILVANLSEIAHRVMRAARGMGIKTLKHLILFMVILTCFPACKKSTQPELPPASHNGANVFGCKINGEAFMISGKSYRGSPTGVTAIPYTNTAWLIEGRNGNKSISLEFDYNGNPHVPGTFELKGNYPFQGYYFNYVDGTVPTASTEYITDSVHMGSVTLTDYTSTFAAGTFAFDAMNGEGTIVHITEGRFDISF